MKSVRRLLAQRHFAALLCAIALLLKLLVPTGYMIATDHGQIAITICSGVASEPMSMAMPGMRGEMPDHGAKDHGKTEMPCPFSGLSAASLGAVDPIQLAALVAFILVAGLFPVMLPTLARRIYLRPPLRGPPAAF